MLGFGFNKDKVRGSAERCVQQGKLQNAISEYEKILKHDPKDLTVINTVGDLYARLGQGDKAVECFKVVGDNYASEGFTLKAIAMYKKLTKINPNLLECLLRLAELYSKQGLHSEARTQYLAAADGYIKGRETGTAISILKKVLESDPDNASVQVKLADLLIKSQRNDEAKALLLAGAEAMKQRNSLHNAGELLKRLLMLDKEHARGRMMQAEILIETGDAAGAISTLEWLPDLDSRPEALRTLMRAYLAQGNMADAEPIARKLYSVHGDLNALATIADKICTSDPDRGLKFLDEYSDRLISHDTDCFVALLRALMSKFHDNVASLEKVLKHFHRAGEHSQDAEFSEMIAHACVQSGDLQRAAQLYKELALREPDNPVHAQNYRQILIKLGADPTDVDAPINNAEAPLVGCDDEDWTALANRANAQKLGEEEGDLKDAPADLSLEAPPRPTQRFVGAAIAAQEFEIQPSAISEDGTTELSPSTGIHEFDAIAAPPSEFAGTSAIVEAALQSSSQAEPEKPKESVNEVDLSDDWDMVAATPQESSESNAADVDDTIEEVRFYLAESMWTEASAAIEKLASLAPSHAALAELRAQLAARPVTAPISIVEPTPEPIAEVAKEAVSEPSPADELAADLDGAFGALVGGSAPPPVVAAPSQLVVEPVAMSAAATATAVAPEANSDASMLDDLFDEFKQEMDGADSNEEDPETHYNLGIAFKEMGLLDEAIGEFQKVAQAVDRGAAFTSMLPAYTWTAACFVEKGVPEAAYMWYQRALKIAGDADTRAAILYDLGSAYEMANDREKAREAFTNVMAINIDFRDVSERIRALKS